MSRSWNVRLAWQAEQDFVDIVQWTEQHFGERQAQSYADTLTLAIQALTGGPDQLGIKERNEIFPGIRTLHVARQGRKGRHFLVLRVVESRTMDVLRILHDGMDLRRHMGAAEGDADSEADSGI